MVPAVLHQATSNHHAEPNITAMSQGVCHPKWASHWYHVKHFVTVMFRVRQSKIFIVTHELYIGDSALWTAFWCNESQQLFQVSWRHNPYMNSPMITKYASDDYVCINNSQKVKQFTVLIGSMLKCLYSWLFLLPNHHEEYWSYQCSMWMLIWKYMMTSSKGNFSALLAICAGNSPLPGEFPALRPVTRSFDVFFDLRLNKRLSKRSWGWWFQTQSRPLWRHRNETEAICTISMPNCLK